MRHLASIALILVAALASRESAAQLSKLSTSERTVRAVVDSFYSAVDHERWDAAATFVDTTRFAVYLRQQVRNARAYVPPPPPSVEQFMAQDSTMPRAVAEWQMQQYRKYSTGNRPFDFLQGQFTGVESPQRLAALSTTQALARWLEAMDPRLAFREMVKRSGCPDSVAHGTLPLEPFTIRGVAFGNDTTAYVVAVGGTPIVIADPGSPNDSADVAAGEYRVLALHRLRGAWRLEPRLDLLGSSGMAISEMSCDHD